MATDPLAPWLTDFNQEILGRITAAPEGALAEEVATACMLEILEAAGHTEGAQVCTDLRLDRAERILHKINGYAFAEADEMLTLDLFVTRYFPPHDDSAAPPSFLKADLDRAVAQGTAFLNTALKGYVRDLEPAAPAYQLAWYLSTHESRLLRARVFILTNGRPTGAEVPANHKVRNVLVSYELFGADRLMRDATAGETHAPLDITFPADAPPIRCLPMPVASEGYQTLLAIMPGSVLADLYQEYGQRLLERNVRAFLQFSTKVNRGIQQTITTSPERFLAYNNGLAATAAEVELTADGTAIRRIRDLQIVNGGQTTAAICQTRLLRRDPSILDRVFVQMKLTVLTEAADTDEFVGLIARFANTQNAIRQTDLSANSPFNVALEKLSRTTWAPALTGTGDQTHWFFERARGQYQVALARGGTPAGRRKVLAQNPKQQVITKDVLGKLRLAWEQRPEMVVRGGEKVYAEFARDLKSGQSPNGAWFQDLVALAILWREADTLYARNPDLRGTKFLAVPYTLAWLNLATGGTPTDTRLNLPLIWQKQRVSPALRDLLAAAVPAVDAHIRGSQPATVALPSEWAKKPACWEAFREVGDLGLTGLLAAVRPELLPSGQVESRHKASDDGEELKAAEVQRLREEVADLGPTAWKRIEAWGARPGPDGQTWLSGNQCSLCDRCASPRQLKLLVEPELRSAHRILDLVFEHQPDLLFDLEESAAPTGSTSEPQPAADLPITLELVEALRQWDRKQKFFRLESAEFLGQIARGQISLSNAHIAGKVRWMVGRAVQKDFQFQTVTSQ